jgi:hypothetical protein
LDLVGGERRRGYTGAPDEYVLGFEPVFVKEAVVESGIEMDEASADSTRSDADRNRRFGRFR